MAEKKYCYFFVGFFLLLGLAGCNKSLQHEDVSNSITASDNALIKNSEAKETVIYRGDNNIEAIAGAYPWLVWAEDDDQQLKLARLNEPELAISLLPALNHDVDLLCLSADKQGIYDLFIHDGDGFFYQYWLSPEQNKLRLVRRIATNPDIEHCAFEANELIYLDPYIGLLTVLRDPETDSILQRADSSRQNLIETASLLKYSWGASMVAAPVLTVQPGKTVSPVMETAPVSTAGDAADDPVILVSSQQTWIVGTNKKRGLAVYDLAGKQQHFVSRGRVNNVDAVPLTQDKFLLAASNRTHKTIDLFDADLANDAFVFRSAIAVELDDPYGLCMARVGQEIYIFIGDSEGVVEQWKLISDVTSAVMIRRFEFASQTEGCVVDAGRQQLYIGEEDHGIWRIDLNSGTKKLVEAITAGRLVADVEGMDIYQAGDQEYLLASSQGDNSYMVYQLNPWAPVGKFTITADILKGIDGASETDGLAVSSVASTGFPTGMLVVQDGRNRAPEQNQNFKVIDWSLIQALINQWQQEP